MITPIWFMDMYLFARSFFDSNPLYMNIVIAYCIATGWLLLNFVFSSALNDRNKLKKSRTFEPMIMGASMGTMCLLFLTPIWYFTKWKFSLLILIPFSGILIIIYFFRVSALKRRHARSVETNKPIDNPR
jgi:hypothetical protein